MRQNNVGNRFRTTSEYIAARLLLRPRIGFRTRSEHAVACCRAPRTGRILKVLCARATFVYLVSILLFFPEVFF